MAAPESSTLPLVTVVTPVYNIAKYVGEAIDSVLRQTFTNFEYLVIDDGSQDNSIEVVRSHIRDDPRVRLLAFEHKGLSAVRNTGIREARGKYIAYLDGDDRWHPRFLDRQVSLIESLPADVGVVFCRSRMILENGTLAFLQLTRPGQYDFDALLVHGNPPRNGSSLLIKKTCFEDAGGFDESVHYVEDFECWLRIARLSKTPLFWGNKHYLLDQRLRPGQVTKDRSGSDYAILQLLAEQTPHLRHAPAGLAYVCPAIMALKFGNQDDLANKLALNARTAGISELARTNSGRQFLFWYALPPSGRKALRTISRSAREAIKTANLHIRGS
jgi:glycosyltransferase involved in cell wall biosynthesis